MSIILNERDYAEYALKNNYLSHKPTETLSRVAKYYYSEGFSKKDIHIKLEDFLLQCDPNTAIVKWQDTIDRQIKEAEKYPLVEIDGIPITKAELDICNKLEKKQSRRLMFALICLAKLSNIINTKNNNWVNRPDKEIFKLANIVTPIKRQSLMLNDLRELGLIKFSKKVDNININVTCINNDSDPILYISDFRNLGYQYLKYCGEPYFECQSCGITIKRANNCHKYCTDCASEIKIKQTVENRRNKIVH